MLIPGPTVHLTVKAPQAYLFLASGFEGVDPAVLSRTDIAGYQIIYSWKQLEPSKGQYDFQAIEADLARTNKLHKKLFIQIQDRFFCPQDRNLPDYLLREPMYGGGLVAQRDNPGEGKAVGSGWVSEQWNPHVRERFQRLLGALARSFDGRVEGVNLPESSADLDVSHTGHGFSPEAYFQGEMENAGFAAKAFKTSRVVQYVNFWPGEWDDDHHFMTRLFAFAAKHKIGLGGPDIVPYRKGQMHNSYPFFHAYRGQLPLVAMAVQEPTLTYKNPKTGKPFTKESIVAFAQGYLGANIVFWSPLTPWLRKG